MAPDHLLIALCLLTTRTMSSFALLPMEKHRSVLRLIDGVGLFTSTGPIFSRQASVSDGCVHASKLVNGRDFFSDYEPPPCLLPEAAGCCGGKSNMLGSEIESRSRELGGVMQIRTRSLSFLLDSPLLPAACPSRVLRGRLQPSSPKTLPPPRGVRGNGWLAASCSSDVSYV